MFHSTNLDVAVSASASFDSINGKVSSETDSAKSDREAFSNTV